VRERVLNGVDVIAGLMGAVRMAGRINANNSINLPPAVPATPGALDAHAVSAVRVDLSWTDNASDESGFKIERATLSDPVYRHFMTVGPNVESYSDTGLGDLTTYYYKVRAFNAAGDSDAEGDDAVTYLAGPGDLIATPASSSRIDLSWTDYSGAESGFRIERKLEPEGTYLEIDRVGENVTTYSDWGLEASTAYYYRVNAYADDDRSEYSNEAYATTSSVSASSSEGSGNSLSADSGNDVDVQPVEDGGGGGGGCFVDAAIKGAVRYR
jgi:hypothetical protein